MKALVLFKSVSFASGGGEMLIVTLFIKLLNIILYLYMYVLLIMFFFSVAQTENGNKKSCFRKLSSREIINIY